MLTVIKNHKIKFALGVISTLISPFILMCIVYGIDSLGGQLIGDMFHIVPVDKSKSASIYEYLYLYSQYLNVIVMGILTLGLCVFAFKDFIYRHFTEVKIKLYVGENIKIAINHERTYFHIALAFKNESPKSGIIDNIEMIFEVNNVNYNYTTRNEMIEKFVEREGETKKDIFDGEPFSYTPIEGEGAIRKFVTFDTGEYYNMDYRVNEKYYLKFKFGSDEQIFELSFNQNEIDTIEEYKNKHIKAGTAGNFNKEIKRVSNM